MRNETDAPEFRTALELWESDEENSDDDRGGREFIPADVDEEQLAEELEQGAEVFLGP